MNSFIFLFLCGIGAYVVLKLVFSRFLDNSSEIDLEVEQKLTENQKWHH